MTGHVSIQDHHNSAGHELASGPRHLLLAGMLFSCSPRVDNHGNEIGLDNLTEIVPGKTAKPGQRPTERALFDLGLGEDYCLHRLTTNAEGFCVRS